MSKFKKLQLEDLAKLKKKLNDRDEINELISRVKKLEAQELPEPDVIEDIYVSGDTLHIQKTKGRSRTIDLKKDKGIFVSGVVDGEDFITFELSDGTSYEVKRPRDGKDGKNGLDGKDGKDGRDGIDGETPIRGTDYMTKDDFSVLSEKTYDLLTPRIVVEVDSLKNSIEEITNPDIIARGLETLEDDDRLDYLALKNRPDLVRMMSQIGAGHRNFGSGGGSSPTVFVDLSDTPSSFSGNKFDILQVNSAETALEYKSFTSGSVIYATTDGELTENNTGFNFDGTKLSLGGVDTMTVNGAAISTKFAVHESDGITSTEQEFHRHSDTTNAGASIYFARSRGSEGSETIVNNSDRLGLITFVGHDGIDYATSSQIRAVVSGTPGSNQMGGDLILLTSPDGSQTLTEGLRVDLNQQTTFAGQFIFPNTDGTANQVLATNGSGTVSWSAVAPLVSGTANEVAYFDGTGALTSNSNFAYTDATQTLAITGITNITNASSLAGVDVLNSYLSSAPGVHLYKIDAVDSDESVDVKLADGTALGLSDPTMAAGYTHATDGHDAISVYARDLQFHRTTDGTNVSTINVTPTAFSGSANNGTYVTSFNAVAGDAITFSRNSATATDTIMATTDGTSGRHNFKRDGSATFTLLTGASTEEHKLVKAGTGDAGYHIDQNGTGSSYFYFDHPSNDYIFGVDKNDSYVLKLQATGALGSDPAFILDSNDRIALLKNSTSTTMSSTAYNSRLTIHQDGTSNSSNLALHSYNASDAEPSRLFLFRSKGNFTTPTVVANGSEVGEITFAGYDGTDYEPAARIRATVNGTVGSTLPTKIEFFTSSASAADVKAVTIDEDQVFQTHKGRKPNKTRVTTTYTTLVTDDEVFGNTDGGGYTITLMAGVDNQRQRIINTGSSGNTLTVAPNGSEHLYGVNSGFTLNDGESIYIVYDATDGWY